MPKGSYEFDCFGIKAASNFNKVVVIIMWLYGCKIPKQLVVVTIGNNFPYRAFIGFPRKYIQRKKQPWELFLMGYLVINCFSSFMNYHSNDLWKQDLTSMNRIYTQNIMAFCSPFYKFNYKFPSFAFSTWDWR